MSPAQAPPHPAPWDADFSSAIHNRTGKYFVGRDLIEDQRALIGRVLYWRVSATAPPAGLAGKLLGRMMAAEHRLRRTLPAAPPRARARPLLHLDPFSVLHRGAAPNDIVLCHDVGPVTHPALFDPAVAALYRAVYARIAASGCRVVFVSEASRSAYRDHFGTSPRHAVIYPALRAGMTRAAAVPIEGIAGPFLLTVGSIGRRKNQAAAIAGFARSGLAVMGWNYVLAGAREPGADAVLEAARATPGVRVLDYVSDAALAWLYASAGGFVLPSLLEGFGVPVAEAIAAGLVPAVTAGGVLHEVAGDGALPLDPDDPDDIADVLRHLAGMTDAERMRRRTLLNASIARFAPERFRREWRAMLEGAAAPSQPPRTAPAAAPRLTA